MRDLSSLGVIALGMMAQSAAAQFGFIHRGKSRIFEVARDGRDTDGLASACSLGLSDAMRTIAPKLATALLAVSLSGAHVSAQDAACSMENATPVPALEAAKTLFGTGDYRGFFNASTPLVADRDAQFETMMGGVVKAVPNGFSGCATVLQRRDAGGMVQEVSLFLVQDGGGTIALYTMPAPLSGAMKTLLFTFSSDIGAILSAVR